VVCSNAARKAHRRRRKTRGRLRELAKLISSPIHEHSLIALITFRVAGLLLNDKQDLIHKATGWLLREAGKLDEVELQAFSREALCTSALYRAPLCD
jgi:hypothetical protein